MKNNVPVAKEKNQHNDMSVFAPSGGDFHNLVNYFWNYMDMPLKNDISDLEPKIEVFEDANNVTVTAELPGIDEDDVDVKLSADGYLTISGEKKEKNQSAWTGNYFSEISYGMFKRTVPLPWDLDTQEASADYHDGLLTIKIPKLPTEKQKTRKINIRKTPKA